MEKKQFKYLVISEELCSEIYSGGYQPDRNAFYDLSYMIAYGFAWISNYIGNHSSSYGLAFK